MTPAARAYLDELAKLDQQSQVERMPLRTAFGSLTYNFGEEIEAAVRSVLPEALGGGEYETIRDDLRQRLAAYKEQYPGEALTAEIAGALLPTAAAAMMPGGQGVAAVRSADLASRATQLARGARGLATTGAEGAVSYAGADEDGLTTEDILPALGTAAITAVGGKGAEKVISGTGAVGTRVINFARERMGNKAADAVQAELLRLAETSGRSVDDVVNDIMNGRVMAENATLAAAVRSLRSQQGPAATRIDNRLAERAEETRQAAQEGLQEGLTPRVSGNVQRAFNATDDELARIERREYNRVFGSVPQINDDIAQSMIELARLYPQAVSRMSERYRRKNLVPLFKETDSGTLEFARAPDLEDAEILRRELGMQADKEFRTPGEGGLGREAKDAEQALRKILDNEFPGLAQVRASAATRRSAQEAFNDGKRIFSKSVDDAEIMFEKAVAEGPEAVAALQAGAMSQLRNLMARRQNITGKLADPDSAEGRLLSIIFPNEGIDQIRNRLSLAEGARDLRAKVQQGSMTAPQQQAAAQEGRALAMSDVSGVMSGDPIAIISATRKLLGGVAPGLSPAQRDQVAEVLFSEDPAFVRRMMTNEATIDEVMAKIQSALAMAGATARRTTAVEAGQVTQGQPAPMRGLLGL